MSAADVMVVDDNPVNLSLLEDMLTSRGLSVRSFPLGRLALAAAAAQPPGLFLLDINMPELNGYELCVKLKQDPALCDIPVVFLSALTSAEDRLRCFQSGGVDYVSKPFHVEEVQARVDAHLKLRRMQEWMANDNERLETLVRKQVRKIADSHRETIFAIARLADTRDGETGLHLERIQVLCRILAEGLRRRPECPDMIDSQWIEDLFHASALHDIGKVGIPDHILLKPGPLTPGEFAVMKTHATLGADTLRQVRERYAGNQFVEMGIEIAQSHHERWDGAGYPEGLSGQSIPLSARIVALADCYDALRSPRCYKSERKHEDAAGEIIREAGRQFDPLLVDVFAETSNELRDAWDRAAA